MDIDLGISIQKSDDFDNFKNENFRGQLSWFVQSSARARLSSINGKIFDFWIGMAWALDNF